jgi:outer membrane protein
MKKILLIPVALLFVIASQAQQVNSELKTLIEKSFSYSPQIQESEEIMNAAELRTGLVKTGYVPTLNANATYSYMAPVAVAQIPTGPASFQEIRFQPNNNYNANLSLSYTVYDFGRMQANVRKSKQELALSGDNLGAQQTLLAAQISQYYYGIIYLQKSVEIEDSLIGVLSENRRMTESKVNNGDALKLDLLSIQSSLDMEIMRREEIKTSLQKQLIFIEYLTGVSNFSVQNKAFDFNYGNREVTNIVDAAKKQNFDFVAANRRLEISKSDLRFNRSQFLPFLNVNAATGYKNGYMPDVNQMRFNYMAGAGISIPILDAVKTAQQIKITKSVIKQQEWKIQNLENSISRDIKLAMADVNLQQEKLGLMEGQLQSATEALRIANTRFKNGTSTYLELINAAYNLQKVQLQKVQIEYNLCLGNIELARLSGTKFY